MPEGVLNTTVQIESVQRYMTPEIQQRLLEFVQAPMNNPDLLTAVLPLVMGGFIMDFYFGKHKNESLGWNTSVGNAVVWMATGVSLLMAETMSQPELYATYALIGTGAFVTFMDFFHIWPSTVAFIISSSALVYTLAYTLVVLVKTDMAINQTTMVAAGAFFIGINIFLKVIKALEEDESGFSSSI